jgi:hypothetical protein
VKKLLLFFSLTLFSLALVFGQEVKKLDNIGNENPNEPSFKFQEEEFDFKNIKQGDVVNHDFSFTNTGKEPLVIANAQGSCGCTVPTWPKEPIAPGATAVIKVTFNSAGKSGMQDKTVTLNSNAKQNPMVLHLKGNVDKPAEQTSAKPEKK